MITGKNFINIKSLLNITVGISPMLIILSTFSLPSIAQKTPNSHTQTIKPTASTQLIKFPTSQNRGKPKKSQAGGRRGNTCLVGDQEQQNLIAIMPTWDNEGKTVQNKSSLYIFVPENKTKIGEFVLIDEEGNETYVTNFIPPNQPGIVQVNIPASADIKVGKSYQWYFTLICDSNDRSRDEYVHGSLERTEISPLLNSNLQKATTLKQAEIYVQEQIWYDAINNVAKLRKENPQIWVSLLESVGLKELANQPFLELGKPKKNN